VELREPPRQREPQPETALGTVEGRRTLYEELEDAFQVLRGDARPVVANGERDPSVLSRGGDRDPAPSGVNLAALCSRLAMT